MAENPQDITRQAYERLGIDQQIAYWNNIRQAQWSDPRGLFGPPMPEANQGLGQQSYQGIDQPIGPAAPSVDHRIEIEVLRESLAHLRSQVDFLRYSFVELMSRVDGIEKKPTNAGEVITTADVSPIDRAMSKKWTHAALLGIT